jgi:ATP-dependent DNA helicase DinG
MKAGKRLSPAVIRYLAEEIREAGGNEVYAFGWLDDGSHFDDSSHPDSSHPDSSHLNGSNHDSGRHDSSRHDSSRGAKGLVMRAVVQARGNKGAVLALPERQELLDGDAEGAPPDVLIHNHPSGFLVPSDNDLVIASRASEVGMGSFIIDNDAAQVYVVVEPTRRRVVKKLDAERICASLEAGGAVASRLPVFELRPSQLALMRLIIRGFNEDALVAAEAGTGVGKSFAYLLPALNYARDNDERIVISTATINLQQQLYDKDIPLVAAALDLSGTGKKIKVALVKGRGNYLCRRRLTDALREIEASLIEDEEIAALRAVNDWAETTATGSRSDLSFLPPEAVWSRVCSEGDLCMGMRCPERERCFFLALRKTCSDARILVVNHHLLFADLAARVEGAGYDATVVLPPYTRVVLDEAHTVEDSATSFFSESFSRLGLFRNLGRLYRQNRAKKAGLLFRLGTLIPQGAADADRWTEQAGADIQTIRKLCEELDGEALALCREDGSFRLVPAREGFLGGLISHLADLRRRLSRLAEHIRDRLETLPPDAEDDPAVWEIKSHIRRLDAAASVCSAFLEYKERGREVIWIERHGGSGSGGARNWAEFHVTPIDVASPLKEALFEHNKTVICVSATLTVNGRFDHWGSRSGFTLMGNQTERETLTGVFPSPFPYASSVLLAIPADAPLPEQPDFRAFVDEAVGALAASSGGSALILFTSYEALRSAWTVAQPGLEKLGIRCLKQGDDDRARLLKTFLEDESCVLFATHSFWVGVDAPGNTLRLVILCRLPFKSPSDPVFEARCEAVERQGGNAFMDLSLPESVIKFKQGFGRLMRRSSDHGVVAVLDGRVLHKRYGDYFLRSIPETRKSFAEFSAVLRDTENFLWSRKLE